MSRESTKHEKLQNVVDKETYCDLITNLLTASETELEVAKKNSENYRIAKLEKEIFELKKSYKINKQIADDFRNNYEAIFLPQYEARLEECYTNFDEVYKITLDNYKDRIRQDHPLRISIDAYPKENPNNEDESLMIMFYEQIREFVNALKLEKDKSKNHLRKA